MGRDQFAEGLPLPQLHSRFSLAANLATGMVLVDYALHGLATPTPWAAQVASRLPERSRRSLDLLRSVLAHGTVLREFLLLRTSGEEDWPVLRAQISGWSGEVIQQLVTDGIKSGLAYYRTEMTPMPDVERWLRKAGTHEPDGVALALPAVRLAAMRALLESWRVPEHEPVLALVQSPEALRTALVQFLDDLWAAGFEAAWQEGAPRLRAAADGATFLLASGQTSTVEEMLLKVTGLQAAPQVLEELRRAPALCFLPCLHLGRYLSVFQSDETAYVLYEPSEAAARPAPGTARQVIEFGDLGPALEAMGDTTRLQILAFLAERDGVIGQRVVEELGINQSTLSRNMAQLERSGLVRVQREGNAKIYTVDRQRVRHICSVLVDLLG